MVTITGIIKRSGSKIKASESVSNRFVKIFVKFCFISSKSKIMLSLLLSHFKSKSFVKSVEYFKSSGNFLNM